MRSKYFYILSTLSIILIFAVAGCKKEWKDAVGSGPEIIISDAFKTISGINVGDEVTIPVSVKSESGVKRLAYYFIKTTANGTEAGTAVNIDRDDFPKELQHDIVFTITDNMSELVIVSFNKENFSSEVHIAMSEIRQLPVLTFKDGIDFQQTVFENKKMKIEGQITSAFDLESITYQTLINGTYSGETPIAFTDKKNTPFEANVTVVDGLSAIIIKAVNIYDGKVVDTFKIGSVAADAVSIALEGGMTDIDVIYADSVNTISGSASSGSDMKSLSYAISTNGVYGSEQAIDLGTPLDQFAFNFSFTGTSGMDAIRISGENEGGKTQVIEYPIEKVYTKLLHFSNIVLTTEIGPGKNNWFSAYQAPHIFDITNAAQNQLMLDFAFIKYTATSNRIVPAAVFNASTNYRNATAPYMVGFTKAPYTLVTANRPHINDQVFNELGWDGELNNFLQSSIIAPTSQGGENYNLVVANRRVSGDMIPGSGFVIGWGSWNFTDNTVNNQAFGLVIVKAYTEENGFATVTLDIKVPAQDNRTKFNPVSLFDYP